MMVLGAEPWEFYASQARLRPKPASNASGQRLGFQAGRDGAALGQGAPLNMDPRMCGLRSGPYQVKISWNKGPYTCPCST